MKHTVKEMHAKIVHKNGSTLLRINDRDMYYAAYRSFRPRHDNVSDFYNEGYRIFCIHTSGIMSAMQNRSFPYSEYGPVWMGDDEYEWDNLKKQTDMFNKSAPDAYYLAMIDLNTPDWMLRQNPEMRDTWKCLIQDVSNPIWIESAKKYIKKYIEKIDELLPGKVFGVALLAGGTTEWYTRDFREAIKNPSKNHLNDCGGAVPDREALGKADDGIFRCFKDDPEVLRYFKYYCKVVPDIICDFAKTVKECSDKTVSVFFGYVVADAAGIPGHDYGLICQHYNEPQIVFDCADIDIILGPASYDLRKLNSTSASRVPMDSLTLSGKLYVHEIDSTTYVAYKNKTAGIHDVVDEKFSCFEETAAYLRREIGMILAKGHGFWIFDMFGNWYKDARLMREMNDLNRLCNEAAKQECHSISEIAFFIDCESNYYLCIDSDYPMFQFQVEQLNKIGAPWDCYLITDLFKDNFNTEQYKLYIFPNIFKYSVRLSKKLDELRNMGKSIVFMHAPGYVDDGGFNVSNMEKYTDIRLKKCDFEESSVKNLLPDTQIDEFDFSHRINSFREKEGGKMCRTRFHMPPVFEIDEECDVWGRFKANGAAAFGVKERGKGFDAFCAVAPIPAELLSKLCDKADVFSYSDLGTVVYMNSRIITVYSYNGGKVKLRTKYAAKLTDWYTKEVIHTDKNGAVINFMPHETKIFFADADIG